MPARNFGRRYERAAGRCEGRSVQRLANMANRLMPAGVPMQKTAARRQIEYGEAEQHRCVTLERLRGSEGTALFHV